MAHFTDRDMQRKGPCGVPWGVDVQTLRRGSLASLALVALACGEGMACCGQLGPRPREQGGWKALPPSLSGQAAWVLRSLSPRASSQPALPVHTHPPGRVDQTQVLPAGPSEP